MNCAVHQDAEATGYCRNCGKPMCPQCVRPVRDVLYCEDCLARLTGVAAAATAPPPVASYIPPMSAEAGPLVPAPTGSVVPASGGGNPAVAFILGFCVPGLGAVYNGEFNKALIHIVVFAAMIVGLTQVDGAGPYTALGLLLAGFVFYMAFDAMRTAQARRAGTATVDPLESWSKSRPIGPIILIVVGAMLLLNNFDWFPFWRFSQMWPLILIVVGVLMFRNRLGPRS